MKISVFLIASCITLMAADVQAEIYTWKDSRGVTHYANSMYDVPDRYRARVKTVNLGIEEKGDNKTSQQVQTGEAASQPLVQPVPTVVKPIAPLQKNDRVPRPSGSSR